MVCFQLLSCFSLQPHELQHAMFPVLHYLAEFAQIQVR